MRMTRVILESPFAASDKIKLERNINYARACMRDCLVNYNESPFASHLLYTQDCVLDDDLEYERRLGIDAGLDWGEVADKTVVYTDFGISKGMRYGIDAAINNRRTIEFRKLGGIWNAD